MTLGRSGRGAGAAPDAADLQVQALPVPDALNAVIGFAQEYSAERTAETLQEMVPHLPVAAGW